MNEPALLSRSARVVVLLVAFGGLLFDGVELGMMPIASLSIVRDLLGSRFNDVTAGDWFAWLTASLMFGAAVGGIWLGALGDRKGRTRALGISIVCYSLFAGAGCFVTSLEQMLVLRFLVGLGVGGVWPNGVALVSECWPNVSRPAVSGIMGAGIYVGILLLSHVARIWHITPESWRWLFAWSAVPAVLGIVAVAWVPESPKWQAARQATSRRGVRFNELFRPPLLRSMFFGIALSSIPMVGAWASSKWMIPWSDKIAGISQPGYKASAQGYWAVGAVLGSFFGAQLASRVGRRSSYFLISLGSVAFTCGIFLFTAPLRQEFLPLVFCQGFIATLFFGWLPLYLPELFPTRVRATGTGIAYNTGRFATAFGVLAAGSLVAAFGGDYAKVGAATGLIYALGMFVIWWAPNTDWTSLENESPIQRDGGDRSGLNHEDECPGVGNPYTGEKASFR